MKIINHLPQLRVAMEKWVNPPDPERLMQDYLAPTSPHLDLIFGKDAHGVSADLNHPDFASRWTEYRSRLLTLDPESEEIRTRRWISKTEELFGVPLRGELQLFGAFEYMDGYARYESGQHRVFMGVDESFDRDPYLDVLMTHEFGHVAREGQPEVWHGFGLSPLMTNPEFTDQQPVIEHLFGEGLSCWASEQLVPSLESHWYCYQTQESMERIFDRKDALNEVIHTFLSDPAADYSSLYQTRIYGSGMPSYAHYYWAWRWAREVVREFGRGQVQKILKTSSKEWLEHALDFRV
jgi:hypothetical protein